MKTQYYIILLVALFSACTRLQDEPSTKIISQDTLSSVTIRELKDMEIYETWGFTKQGQHIILSDASGLKTIENIYTESRQGSAEIKTISSERNMQTYSSLTSGTNGNIAAFDFRNGILHEYGLQSIATGNKMQETTIQLPQDQQHLIAVKGSDFILSTGLYEEGRYLYYPLDGENSHYNLSYPKHPDHPRISQKTTAILYASTVLRLRQDEKAFVCADMYSGYIDFCTISEGNIKRVKEIYLHYPQVYISEQPTIEVAYRCNSPLGFSDISVSNNRVYAIYSGRSYQEDPIHFIACETLFEFDWEGNLLSTHTLDTPVTNISYDSTENSIYAMGYTPKRSLLKIKLKHSLQ